MGKCRLSDIGHRVGQAHIGYFRDKTGGLGHLGKPILRDAGIVHLDLKVGNHSGKICISTPFPKADVGALNLVSACLHSCNRICDRTTGIVVTVHPDHAGKLPDHIPGDASDFIWKAASIGITEHQLTCTRVFGCLKGLYCIIGVLLVAIKKVLGVKDHPLSKPREIGNCIRNHLQIFLWSRPENLPRLPFRAFSEHCDPLNPSFEHRLAVFVLRDRDAPTPGRPKCYQSGSGQ